MINLKRKNILVTGGNRIIGVPLIKQLDKLGAYTYKINHQDCNLLYYDNLLNAIKTYGRPDYIYNLAGYNGGISLNQSHPADIFGQTLKMTLNVFDVAVHHNITKVVTPLTSCGYPPYETPLKEEDYLQGEIHGSVRGHGYAKRSIFIYGQLLNKQYGNRFVFPIFNNCFGPHCRVDEPDRLKVCDSLIVKFVEAEKHNKPQVILFGDGSPYRELLFGNDAAAALINIMQEYEDYEQPINLGWGRDIQIKILAELIKEKVGYQGEIVWDTTKSNGVSRKLLDINKMQNTLNWRPSTMLEDGIAETIKWYKNLKGY